MNELTHQQQQEVERLFENALKVTAEECKTLLDSTCNDSAVRAEVESLLAARPFAERLVNAPIADSQALSDALESLATQSENLENNPGQIGPYRVLSKLGEGGMGVVYLAEQSSPVHRRVALKVIKQGMDTKQVVARFDTERGALAMMNHLNVAKVFDAGASDEGRPYFVMEFVEGIPITNFCDEHSMATKDRLDLFVDTCQAIQHAHQKGIIHRDIKPSNVLVTQLDDKPIPKVIDFGVAKATKPRFHEQSIITEQGQLIGTPGYMSPEQANISTGDVDTRVDIYSLGILLYELLVGSRPFSDDSLQHAGYSELQRVIREVEPPKPSTRLSSLGDSLNAIADKRCTQPRILTKQVQGDLDWIVMKCLEKDRMRRYETVHALVLDIQRHLADEPVLAGPPSIRYRIRKFTRRNKNLVTAVAVVASVLVAGVISTAVFAAREAKQRRVAQSQTETSEAINRFLTEMLATIDPKHAQGRDVGILRDVLDRASGKVQTELSGQPKVEASVHRTIGQTYMNLGINDSAEQHLVQALEIERSANDGPSAELAESFCRLGVLRDHQGRYDEAEILLNNAIEVRRELLIPDDVDLAASLNQLAMVLLDTGNLGRAKENINEALAIIEPAKPQNIPLYFNIRNTLAAYHIKSGTFAEAETLFREGIAQFKSEPNNPDLPVKRLNLAIALKEQGEFEEAESVFHQALAEASRIYGPDHQLTLSASNGLAAVLEKMGRYEESESLHRQILVVRRRTLGNKHPDLQSSLNNLASVLRAQDRIDESIEVFRESLALAREIRPAQHPLLALAQAQLAFALRDTGEHGNYKEAEQLALSALAIFDVSLPAGHPFIVNTLRGLKRLYETEAMNSPNKLSEIEARLSAIDADLGSEDP
ncbi:MAG: hypothetical protein DHS20C16_21840 [Phycisphaerae bacterium]|nr:MAG: hypothetical protein DHS20C16_21840 [Phycisphaerae bacterium]